MVSPNIYAAESFLSLPLNNQETHTISAGTTRPDIPPGLDEENGGPTLRDLCGFMLSLPDQNEANIGNNATGKAWDAWMAAHPEATEVMMRFLAEIETEDGKRITLKDYKPPKKSRLRLVIKLLADEEDNNAVVSVSAKSKSAIHHLDFSH
jgi:hypothetical protein